MLKVVALVLLLAVGLGTAGYAVFGGSTSSSSTGQFLTSAAVRTNVVQQAVATGTVVAAATYGLAFGQPPELDPAAATSSSSASSGSSSTTWTVAAVNATVGATVKAGDILATADTTILNTQLAIDNANLASAQARLQADGGGPTADVVASAKDSVTQAQLAYGQALQGQQNGTMSTSVSIAQAQLALSNAETQLALDKQGPTGASLAVDQDSLNQAEMALKTAEQSLPDLQASDALAIQQAQAAVAIAQQGLANQKAQDQQALADALAALDEAQAKVSGETQGSPNYASDLAALNAANSAYNATQQKATAAEQQAQNAITSADASVTSAQQKATAAEQQAQAQIASARAAVTAAQHAYDLKVEPASTTLFADEKAIAGAQQSLNAAEVQAQTSASTASSQVTSAAQGITAAKDGYATKVAPAPASTIASDQAAVTTAQGAVETVQQSISDAQIVAPVDGTVVSVAIMPGIVARSGYALVLQGSTLEVSADFTETDTPSLANGQAASVTVNAVGATPIDATVTSISPEPSSTSTGGVVTYPVTLTLANPPAAVKVGMSVSVAVTTAQATGVIAVPSVALRGQAGSYSVSVLNSSGQAQTVSVQVGLIANGLAEIQSGLNQGDEVVTGSATALVGGTSGAAGIGIPGLGGGGGFRGGLGGGAGGRGAGGGGARAGGN
ncbi:MAG TPA: HlyD family efflux transporter periplasmic adaptor subunit [Candidatus Saccharimonadales bacterium]|nr:HlyD family efflux transporter periplasmic adaptor subunit [Candidatus Saccharimonadales bacterium]